MTYRMHKVIPVFTRVKTDYLSGGSSHTAPTLTFRALCLPTDIKDDDELHIRIGWKHQDGRNVKIWLIDPSATLDFGAGTGVLVSKELTSTDTNYLKYPVSEGFVVVGSALGEHIRGEALAAATTSASACNLYVGCGASGSNTGYMAGVNLWIESKGR